MAERLEPTEPGWYPTENGTEYWDGHRWGAGGMHLKPSDPTEGTAASAVGEEESEPKKRRNPFAYGAAMALLIILVLNITQVVAVVSLGLQDEYDLGSHFSRGGVLVLVACGITWATCRSWQQWRTAAWIWAVISMGAAFVVVNLQVQAWLSGH